MDGVWADVATHYRSDSYKVFVKPDNTAVHKEKKLKFYLNALSSDALKRAYDMKARAYLPKDKLGEIVPFLKEVLSYEYEPGWKRLLEKLENFFDEQFEPDWKKRIGY